MLAHNGCGMLRAALGIASFSAVTNLIGIGNLSSSSFRRLQYTAC